jgi:hypothetical protein
MYFIPAKEEQGYTMCFTDSILMDTENVLAHFEISKWIGVLHWNIAIYKCQNVPWIRLNVGKLYKKIIF